MKKLLFALLNLCFLSAGAQTVDEVIGKYTANLGGLEAFEKPKTAKLTGTMSVQGNDFSVTIHIINGSATRTDIDIMGNQVINVYKDGKGWKISPLAGITTAVETTSSENNDLRPQSMLAPPLSDYKARGHKVELMGQVEVNGMKAYKIKLVTKEESKVVIYYINTADHVLIKTDTDRDVQGQTVTVENWYSDLKEINGAKFFMKRVQKVNGAEVQTISFDKIELNVTIDEKIFEMPK